MKHIEVERIDRRALQDRTDATDHNEIDAMRGEYP
jgi:hypothetical protein